MGSWDFRNIGVSINEENKEYVKQITDCFDITFEDVHGTEAGEVHAEYRPDMIGNAESSKISPVELYYLLNKLFGKTFVYFEEEVGNNTSDYYYRNAE